MEIGCEGITEHSVLRLIFDSKAARDQQEDIYCKSRYHYCELYRAIYEKYAGDD